MWTSLRSGGWALFSLAWLVGREATKAMNSEKRTLMIQNLDRKRQKENKACWGVSKSRALGNFNKESEGTASTPLPETWTTMLPPLANAIIMRLNPGKWKTHLKKTWKHMSGWLSLPMRSWEAFERSWCCKWCGHEQKDAFVIWRDVLVLPAALGGVCMGGKSCTRQGTLACLFFPSALLAGRALAGKHGAHAFWCLGQVAWE